MVQCLMLERCKKASGIDCTDRDFEQCEFFKNLLKDANKTLLSQKELESGMIILHCYECNAIRKFKKLEKLGGNVYQCITCETKVKFPRKTSRIFEAKNRNEVK